MAAKIRIMADSPEEAADIEDAIREVLEVAGGGRDYSNRGGFGVRRYIEVRRGPRRTVRAESSRDDRRELEG